MSVKLIILGLLMGGEKHPYEMQNIIKMRKIDKFVKLYDGSLYYAVEQLKEKGLIDVSSIIKENKRPDRTVYKITDAGREEFQNLLIKQFSKEEKFYDPIYAALIFVGYGDSKKVVEVINQRTRYIEKKIEVLKNIYAERKPALPRPGHFIYLSLIEHAKTELKLLENLNKDFLENDWSSPPQPTLDNIQ